YISDGMGVYFKIRKSTQERRGLVATTYTPTKDDNSLTHYFLGKTQFDYRANLGPSFNKRQTLGDLLTFTQDASQRFGDIVNKPTGESCPSNLTAGQKSIVYKLREHYKTAMGLIEKLEAEPDEGLVEEDHSSEA